MNTLKLAVIGKDVSKSLSPKMHTFILNSLGMGCSYDAVSIPESEFTQVLPTVFERYDAFNVTIPYKTSVQPYLKEIKGDAEVFGAVNTVNVKTGCGYNTDGVGFLLMLENAEVQTAGKSALVLGSGGAGRSVIKKLLDAGASVSAYDVNQAGLLKVHGEFPDFTPLERLEPKFYDIIVNCTGIGMHKTEGKSPVGEDVLSHCDTAVDLIYTPKISEFLRLAQSLGKKTVNGEAMLFYQAYYADCIYLNITPSAARAKELFELYQREGVNL